MTDDHAALISELGPRMLDAILSGLAEAFKCDKKIFGLSLFICTESEDGKSERVQLFGNMAPDSVAKVCESMADQYRDWLMASQHAPDHSH